MAQPTPQQLAQMGRQVADMTRRVEDMLARTAPVARAVPATPVAPRTPARPVAIPPAPVAAPVATPQQITIPRGATLTGLAQQHGTTPQAIIAANPAYRGFVRDPRGNLIFAGDTLNIPRAGIAPQPATPVQQRDIEFQQEQLQQAPRDEFPLRRIEDEMRAAMDRMRLPDPPPLADEFQRLRVQHGIGDIETQLADVNRRIAETRTLYEGQMGREEERAVPLAVIERRRTDLARQLQREMDSLNLERGVLAEQLNARTNAISRMMEFRKIDYQTARQNYEWEFERQIGFYNSLTNIAGREIDWNERARNNALANLNILANSLSQQGITWDRAPAELQAQMRAQALQAGISPDALPFMIAPASPEIKTQVIGSATAGYSVISIDERTGEVRSIRQVVAPRPEQPKQETARERYEEVEASARGALGALIRPDGFVSLDAYKDLRAEWVRQLGGQQGLFDQLYADRYLSPNDRAVIKKETRDVRIVPVE